MINKYTIGLNQAYHKSEYIEVFIVALLKGVMKMPQVVLQPPGSDAYVNMASPYTNYGSASVLWVGKLSDSTVYRALVQFNVSTIPAGISVLSATLKLYVDYAPSPGVTGGYTPYIITSPWNQGGVTWNNMPSFNTSVHGSTTNINNTGWYQWNVTSIVSTWFTGTYPNYGIIIKGNELTSFENKRAYSGDAVGPVALQSSPILVIEYDMSPPGSNVTLIGRKFTEESYTRTTSNSFGCIPGSDTSEQSTVTFFVKNTGANPAIVKLDVSPNNSDYMQDSPDTVILPGEMKGFVPMIFAKCTRLCYKSANLSQSTNLLIIYQSQV